MAIWSWLLPWRSRRTDSTSPRPPDSVSPGLMQAIVVLEPSDGFLVESSDADVDLRLVSLPADAPRRIGVAGAAYLRTTAPRSDGSEANDVPLRPTFVTPFATVDANFVSMIADVLFSFPLKASIFIRKHAALRAGDRQRALDASRRPLAAVSREQRRQEAGGQYAVLSAADISRPSNREDGGLFEFSPSPAECMFLEERF